MRRVLTACAALLLFGCAENAILEVDLQLPAQPTTGPALFAHVQARSADVVSFDETWAGTDAIEGRELAEEASPLPFSVVAGGSAFTRKLGVRVRFCETPACTGLGDDYAPEMRYRIERAFYRGRRTRVTIAIASVPTAPPGEAEVIEKCDVEGCTSGSTLSYCFIDGRHFCEE